MKNTGENIPGIKINHIILYNMINLKSLIVLPKYIILNHTRNITGDFVVILHIFEYIKNQGK